MSVQIRNMTTADIPFGMRLKTEAGWNQTDADWQRFLRLEPQGCFVAEQAGAIIGTVTTCRFEHVAWIGMMLVGSKHRGQGVGRALFTSALNWLEMHGVSSIRLDATSLGEPLYQSFGFQTQFELGRTTGEFNRQSPATSSPHYSLDRVSLDHLDAVASIDRKVCKTNRISLLRELIDIDIAGNVVRESGNVVAFTLCRPGSQAVQIGPCIASSETAAQLSLQRVMTELRGRRLFFDAPLDHASYRLVRENGLEYSRTLKRMCRGVTVVEDVSCLWASSGPEMG